MVTGEGGGGQEENPEDLSSLTPGPAPRVPHTLPFLLTPTSSPSSHNTWGPQDPFLSQPPSAPSSSHYHPRSESHRSPYREGRQRPGSPPGPSRPLRPPPVKTPTSGACCARSGNSRGEQAGHWGMGGRKPVQGPRWPRPQAFGCVHGRGRGSAVHEPGRPPRRHRHPPSPTPRPPSCPRWETGPSLPALVSRKPLTCRY